MNGRILGSGGWSRHRSLHSGEPALENEALLNPLFDAAKIRAMFVHPQFSRQGIGRALLTFAETAARQAGFKQLELMATLTGEPLYANFGFVVQKRYEEILPDGTPFAVALMVKQIGWQSYGSDLMASTSAASFAPPSGAEMRTH
jgi:GNAT superfamily N-acetyltransferase